ncbi:hypothetical protein WDW89_18280 [Deltaproteobacteria bacterium TL4]
MMKTPSWINDFLALRQKTSLRESLASLTPRFDTNNLESLATHLERFEKISVSAKNMDLLLTPLLTSGNTEHALQMVCDFDNVYHKACGNYFNFNHLFTSALLSIFGRSHFLSRRLLKYPLLADPLLESPFLTTEKSLQTMESELRRRLESRQTWTVHDFKNELRCYKYEEYLRITVRDLGELCPFEETLSEISSIEICCLRMALKASLHIALGSESLSSEELYTNPMVPFAVIGMGKLGGYELNYSSDIDLIFFYDNEPLTEHPENDATIRKKAAQLLIKLMSEVTEEGFVARVDMRLRPGGDSSPLVQSLDQMGIYYEGKGELWERQALIKASVVAGNSTSQAAFSNRLSYFIYSRMIDENMLDEIRYVKSRIEKEHLRTNHLNLKLGVGGIREIEFFVQSFQLLYGGHHPSLRTNNTLQALERLEQRELIELQDIKSLRETYLYLRKLEHRLQLKEEQQTHTIPPDPKDQAILARVMGYSHADIEVARRYFLEDVKDKMFRVRSIFGGLFDQTHVEIEAAIRNSCRFHVIQPDEKELIENFARQLAPVIRLSDQSLLKTRFQRLFENIGVRLSYYELLVDHPSSIERLSMIAQTSEFLWNYLLNHLDLLKQLEQQDWRYTRKIWKAELKQSLESAEDEEEVIDRLRDFKYAMVFLIGSAELDGLLAFEQARKGLSNLAEVILQAAFEVAADFVQSRFGKPVEPNGNPAYMTILGLGKFGGKELSYHSDLDLIFIYSNQGYTDGKKSISNQEYFVKLVQRLISILSTFTRTGYAYKLDTRLRPSGNSGVLVTPLDAYNKYHQASLPWEHQALLKARIVAGDLESAWVERVDQGLNQIHRQWTPPPDIREQIHHLRLRKEKELAGETTNRLNLKEGHGGLLDIEYMTQYLQLKHRLQHPELNTPHTLGALEVLKKHQIVDAHTVDTLLRSYKFLRQLESYLQLLYDESNNLIDFEGIPTETLMVLMQRQGHDIQNLRATYDETTQHVRKIYLQVMQASEKAS